MAAATVRVPAANVSAEITRISVDLLLFTSFTGDVYVGFMYHKRLIGSADRQPC